MSVDQKAFANAADVVANYRSKHGAHFEWEHFRQFIIAYESAKQPTEAMPKPGLVEALKLPTVQSAIDAMFEAYTRLKQLGWSEAIYCPKDGSSFDVIEAGSTGIHTCTYEGAWPTGTWWVLEDGDMSPSRPILYRRATNPKDARDVV